MKDTLARIDHSVWELNKLVSKRPESFNLRADFLEFFHESRIFVERKKGVPEADRSFILLQNREALSCLLMHGAGGSPAEMRQLGEHLFKSGFTVYGMRLALDMAGNGSSHAASSGKRFPWSGLKKKKGARSRSGYNWETCLFDAKIVLEALLTFSPNTYAVGFSFGGTVVLNLLRDFPLRGAVLIAPALFPVTDSRYVAFKLARTVAPFAVKGINPREYALLEFLKETRAGLKTIQQPVLVVHGVREKIISAKSLHFLKAVATNPKSRFELLDSDKHVLVKGEDADKVFRLCTDFLRET